MNELPTLRMDADTVAELSAAYDERMRRQRSTVDSEEEPAKSG
jgi:hypothetical protein